MTKQQYDMLLEDYKTKVKVCKAMLWVVWVISSLGGILIGYTLR